MSDEELINLVTAVLREHVDWVREVDGTQTRGLLAGAMVYRCACGAISPGDGCWLERNSRRPDCKARRGHIWEQVRSGPFWARRTTLRCQDCKERLRR